MPRPATWCCSIWVRQAEGQERFPVIWRPYAARGGGEPSRSVYCIRGMRWGYIPCGTKPGASFPSRFRGSCAVLATTQRPKSQAMPEKTVHRARWMRGHGGEEALLKRARAVAQGRAEQCGELGEGHPRVIAACEVTQWRTRCRWPITAIGAPSISGHTTRVGWRGPPCSSRARRASTRMASARCRAVKASSGA